MGRPTINPKNDYIRVRATKSDKEKLAECCTKTGKTQYDVIMEGIDMVYQQIKK